MTTITKKIAEFDNLEMLAKLYDTLAKSGGIVKKKYFLPVGLLAIEIFIYEIDSEKLTVEIDSIEGISLSGETRLVEKIEVLLMQD